MKKYVKVLTALLLMLTVFVTAAACEHGRYILYQKEMAEAFALADEVYALDVTMTINVTVSNVTVEMTSQIKVIDTEEQQTAYISFKEGSQLYKAYFMQDCVYMDYGDSYDLMQMQLEDFIDSSDAPPVSVDLQKLVGEIKVTKKADKADYLYTLTIDDAALSEVFGYFFEGYDFSGNLVLSAWIGKKSGMLNKMQYDMDVAVMGQYASVSAILKRLTKFTTKGF